MSSWRESRLIILVKTFSTEIKTSAFPRQSRSKSFNGKYPLGNTPLETAEASSHRILPPLGKSKGSPRRLSRTLANFLILFLGVEKVFKKVFAFARVFLFLQQLFFKISILLCPTSPVGIYIQIFSISTS
jgi:hypothetical protein